MRCRPAGPNGLSAVVSVQSRGEHGPTRSREDRTCEVAGGVWRRTRQRVALSPPASLIKSLRTTRPPGRPQCARHLGPPRALRGGEVRAARRGQNARSTIHRRTQRPGSSPSCKRTFVTPASPVRCSAALEQAGVRSCRQPALTSDADVSATCPRAATTSRHHGRGPSKAAPPRDGSRRRCAKGESGPTTSHLARRSSHRPVSCSSASWTTLPAIRTGNLILVTDEAIPVLTSRTPPPRTRGRLVSPPRLRRRVDAPVETGTACFVSLARVLSPLFLSEHRRGCESRHLVYLRSPRRRGRERIRRRVRLSTVGTNAHLRTRMQPSLRIGTVQ